VPSPLSEPQISVFTRGNTSQVEHGRSRHRLEPQGLHEHRLGRMHITVASRDGINTDEVAGRA
jgi:hypothetical protein